MPEGATANSLKFALPTISTPRRRAFAKQGASCFAGLLVFEKYSDPAVVITPFMSMLSLTASFSRVSPSGGGQ